MSETQAQRWRRERGSALLLTLMLTLFGAVLLGLGVDATSLLWVRSDAQTTANLAAAAVSMELTRNPSATSAYLQEAARASAALNGIRHGNPSTAVRLERHDNGTSVLVERVADVYFLRMIRPQPVPVAARAMVLAAGKAAQ